ncbi:MAG: phosphate signaling complex protein PhoU [Alphaproteobacteria bacterium]
MASPDHIVHSYDNELTRLKDTITRMGGLVEQQIESAVQALVLRDSSLADSVVFNDEKVDAMEHEAQHDVVRLLALRQPMARDLREIIVSLKVSSDLERIGDYASNMAKRVIAISQMPAAAPARGIPRMARMVQAMIKDVLDAYVGRSADSALGVWNADREVDDAYNALFRELLTYMMEDPRNITPCTHLLFMAKNIERMGDHATNIAENVYFLVIGEPLLAQRPKGREDLPAGPAGPAGGPPPEDAPDA